MSTISKSLYNINMNKLDLVKSRISEWAIDNMCVPFIVNHEKKYELVGHFIKEFDKLIDYQRKNSVHVDADKAAMTKEDVVRILSMISACGSTESSLASVMNFVNKAAKYELLSPLTFSDDEWNHVSNRLYQSNRHPSVFKEGERTWNIDACGWVIGKCVKLSDEKVITLDYDKTIVQSGTAYVYDSDDDSWTPMSSVAVIKNFDNYMGKQINIRAMEVYDDRDNSADGVDVYTIIRKQDISEEFKHTYYPIDIRQDATAEEKFKKYVESDLEFIIKENIKRFLL